MTKQLIAFADGLVMGTVTHGKNGRLTFLYSDEWLSSQIAFYRTSQDLGQFLLAPRKGIGN
jgi:hypothetical protein